LKDRQYWGGETMFGIEEARKELFDFLSTLSYKNAALRPGELEWSILDILEHLYVIERIMTEDIKQILEKNERKNAYKQKNLNGTLDRSKNSRHLKI
jgi:uncharacterized damage-inducible protein DinB